MMGEWLHLSSDVSGFPAFNPLLVRVHYIERVGTGIQRIKDAVTLLGKGDVHFKFDGNFFIVTFTRNQNKSTTQDINLTLSQKLTPLQEEILGLFENNKDTLFTSEAISKLPKDKYTVRFIRSQLSSLQKLGYINYTGETRSRKWFLIKK